MKILHHTLIIVLICLISNHIQGQDIATINIKSEALQQTREIMIYTPMNYDLSNVTR